MSRALFETASSQHGLLTREQLYETGFTRHRVTRWVANGRLEQLNLNVFAVGGQPPSEKRSLLAAVLETGLDASASHTTAAALWGIAGFRMVPIHVVVCRKSRHHYRLSWQVHQFTGRVSDYQRWIDGIPVTSPALTMLHLAATVSKKRLERAVDNAWSLGILTGADLDDLDARLSRPGRDGLVALREVRAKRDENWTPPQSNLESRFFDLIETRTGLVFRKQAHIAGERWAARVDFLHEPSKTIVEVQSERYHASLTDTEADRLRRKRLEAEGYAVVEVWDNELFGAPDLILDRVASAVFRAA
jgi:very-short-patch-repair endonuclease